mmetsp:Transcript_14820/g.25293  ORF Transcript_14820/g.25293 Transcript_14820/m.25293 type:complete len:238 (+) Transcript_14820:239-952(+)
MRRCVKTRRNVTFITISITRGFIGCRHHGKPLHNVPKKCQTRNNFLVRVIPFHLGGHNRNIHTSRRHSMGAGNRAHKDIILTIHLWTWDDNLDTFQVSTVWNRVIQETNASNDLSSRTDLFFGEVRRVAHNKLRTRHLISTLHANCFALIIVHDFINIAVEHESSPMNGTKARESLRETTKPIHRVNVWARTITRQRITVSLKFLHSCQGWLFHVSLIQLQTHGVRNELVSVWLKAE